MKKIYLKNKQMMQLNSQPIKYRIIKLDKKKGHGQSELA